MLLVYGGSNTGGLIVLGVFIALIINALISFLFGKIAEMKGHSSTKFAWICFFFGFAGWMMVVALPDKTERKIKKEEDEEIERWV